MEWFEYLIIICCVLFILGVIILSIILKRKGKSLLRDCSGNCEICNKTCSNKTKEQLLEEYRKTYQN